MVKLHLKTEFKKLFQAISGLYTLKPTIHLLLLKCPRFPSRINNIYLISPCEIPHLASIALQSQIAGGISADTTTSQSLPTTALVRPVFLHIAHKKHEALHCLTSAPAWRGDARLICWGEGGQVSQHFPRQTKQ